MIKGNRVLHNHAQHSTVHMYNVHIVGSHILLYFAEEK